MSEAPAVFARDVRKRFLAKPSGTTVQALDGVSIEAAAASLTALVGPDGAGKTTLLRLIAGLMTSDSGTLEVLGVEVARHAQHVQDRIGYMPQRFGLYEDLSVQENLDLYADLHGVGEPARRERYARLMAMTDLGSFVNRPAGKLSGGMKQKLGLACTLVRSPQLLLLDEPTAGVDPLSRRELWQIVQQLVAEEGIAVVVSTAYLDEAERCANVFVLHEGAVLAKGSPRTIAARADGLCFLVAPPAGMPARTLQARLLDHPAIVDAVPDGGDVRFIRSPGEDAHAIEALQGLAAEPVPPRLEDGFMLILRQARSSAPAEVPPAPAAVPPASDEVVIEVKDLVRKFGAFTAVANTSFSVRRGEIFGLLGPNGAGKTTTFRMLCGLLPATSGFLRVANVDLRHARAAARRNIGYVSQKFALYRDLTVAENLDFFAGAYGLHGTRLHERVHAVLQELDLAPQRAVPSGQLAGGYKQRLAMAVALVHEPQILFLDEPTSGADPVARREFWRRITALAARGITVIVTTHFMEEAEYCDRIVIQDAGKVLAIGTPQAVRARAGGERRVTMEDAFIAIVQQAREHADARAIGAAA